MILYDIFFTGAPWPHTTEYTADPRIRTSTYRYVRLMDPDAAPDPAHFFSCFQNYNQNSGLLEKNVSLPVLIKGTFTSDFIDKNPYRSHKTVQRNVFLLCLLDDGSRSKSVSVPLAN